MGIKRSIEEKAQSIFARRCTFWRPYREGDEGAWVHPDAHHVTIGDEATLSCPHCRRVLEAHEVRPVAQKRKTVLKQLGKHEIARYSNYRLACAAVVTFSAAFLIYGLQESDRTWYADIGIVCLIIAMPFLVSVILLLEEQISSGYETQNGAGYVKKQMIGGGLLTWSGLVLLFWSHSHFFALAFVVFSLVGVKLVVSIGMEEMAARVVVHHKARNRQMEKSAKQVE